MRIIRRRPPQQLRDRIGSALMHGGANGHLYGFQIQLTALAAVEENPLELLF
jgi:hypothetical protein